MQTAPIHVYRAFIAYNLVSESTSAERRTVCLATLSAWITSVNELFVEGEFCAVCQRESYGRRRTDPLPGHQPAHMFHSSACAELALRTVRNQHRKRVHRRLHKLVFTIPCTATKVLALASVSKSVLATRADKSSSYVFKALGDIHNCYIAE